MCIKLVKKDYHYIRLHGQQNIKIETCTFKNTSLFPGKFHRKQMSPVSSKSCFKLRYGVSLKYMSSRVGPISFWKSERRQINR